MLDRAASEILLRDAEHHIAAAEWRIFCQLEHLEQVTGEGTSTRSAEAVLTALRCGRDAWEARRLEILGRQRVKVTLPSAA
jgi:hypothetical protein